MGNSKCIVLCLITDTLTIWKECRSYECVLCLHCLSVFVICAVAVCNASSGVRLFDLFHHPLWSMLTELVFVTHIRSRNYPTLWNVELHHPRRPVQQATAQKAEGPPDWPPEPSQQPTFHHLQEQLRDRVQWLREGPQRWKQWRSGRWKRRWTWDQKDGAKSQKQPKVQWFGLAR